MYPITKGVSKQLLPIYDKPMVYYPISALMLAGIRDILIISTPYDLSGFKRLLGDGSDYGVHFEYAEQPSPDGLAQAFIIGEKFIGDDCACLVLGDNIFYGNGFTALLRNAVKDAEENKKATVFGYWVSDPERYGVAEFDKNGNCLSIEEKPKQPKSNYAVVGLYFYPNKVVKVAKNIKPSARGELEITTVNQEFLKDGELKVQTLGRGFAWLDTGTHDSLSEASTFVEVIEKRTGLKVGCLEGIAYRRGWISEEKMRQLAQPMIKNEYGQYLLHVIDVSREDWQDQAEVVDKLIRELGAEQTPCIRVFNKCDLCAGDILPHGEDIVSISAKTGAGADELLQAIAKRLDNGVKKVTLRLPYDRGGVLDQLYREAKVESVEYGETIEVVAHCTPKVLGQVRQYVWPPMPEPKEDWE